MKKQGETLIESLISLFFFVVILVPFSRVSIRMIQTNNVLDYNYDIQVRNQNFIELIKSLDYKMIESLEGRYEVRNENEFYNLFQIPHEYRVLSTLKDKKTEVNIKKTNSFYIDENMKKLYIYDLKIGEVQSYYLP